MRKEIKILIGAAATLAVGAAVFFALSGWLEEKYRLYENSIRGFSPVIQRFQWGIVFHH